MVRPKITPALTITKLLGKAFGKKWLIKQVCSNNPTPPVASLTDGARRPNQLGAVATIWASSRLFPKWSFLWSSPTSCQPPPTDCPKPSGRSCRGLWPLDSSREPGSRPETRILKFSDCAWVALDPPKCFRSTWILMKCAAGLDHHHEAALTVYGQAQRSQCRPAEGPLGNKAIN